MKSKTLALATAASAALLAAAAPAFAAAPAAADVEEVVVTGTSIRGVAPVGSNLIAVGQEEIRQTGAQTVQQLLRTLPAVTGFGNSGQGSSPAFTGGGAAPTIHSLGASASNQTLVLIDGHRLPLQGLNHMLADPNMVPPSAVERLEVLPDGASATYGSDAVAGVINFITRRRYEGLEIGGQVSFGDGYEATNFNLVAGRRWDTGSAMIAYGYSYRSALRGSDRDFYRADLRDRGGGDFANFNCSPATVQGGTGNLVYAYPYAAGTGVAATAPGVCEVIRLGDILPLDFRNSGLFKIEQSVGERLTLSTDFIYSDRLSKQRSPRQAIQATVYGPGSTPPGGPGQINPFFQGPPGVTQETIRFQPDELLGGPTGTASGVRVWLSTVAAEYKLGGDWLARLGGSFGQSTTYARGSAAGPGAAGGTCTTCAILALNGTVNASGSLATIGSPPPGNILPLTTANALDVWRPLGSNRTSADVLARLADGELRAETVQNLRDVIFKVDGSLAQLPGGAVKLAAGAEYITFDMDQFATKLGTGPASTSAASSSVTLDRRVWAAFGELLVPIVGSANAMPLVRELNLSLAVRHDNYDDVGSTTNPKVAFTWRPVEDLALRGSWGTSFTAPSLPSVGDANGLTIDTQYSAYNNQQTIPLAFPRATTLPSCSATGCVIGNSVVTGIQIQGGNPNNKPQEGESYSLGFDYTPAFAPGLRVSVTYWRAKLNGLITSPALPSIVQTPGLYDALIISPTAAEIAAATAGKQPSGAIPSQILFIYDFRQRNAFNLDSAGLDYDVRYRVSTGAGDFSAGLSVAQKLKFDQQAGDGGIWFDRLNTAGVNTTFSSLELTGRLNLGWSKGPWSADTFVNYTGSYTNLNGQQPFPNGQKVKSWTTVDVHGGYSFEGAGLLKDSEVYIDVNNLFDADPPFYNASGGYNAQDSSALGRVVAVGFRKSW